jgi:hypothetical protein
MADDIDGTTGAERVPLEQDQDPGRQSAWPGCLRGCRAAGPDAAITADTVSLVGWSKGVAGVTDQQLVNGGGVTSHEAGGEGQELRMERWSESTSGMTAAWRHQSRGRSLFLPVHLMPLSVRITHLPTCLTAAPYHPPQTDAHAGGGPSPGHRHEAALCYP